MQKNLAENYESSSHNSINHSKNTSTDITFKECLISAVWSQSRLVASLLDQAGIAYHRTFSEQALDLFLVLINTEISMCHSIDDCNINAFSALNKDLLLVHTRLISSMDSFVVETIDNTKKQAKHTRFFNRILGKHHAWKLCAKSRFEQIVCPILESKLVNKIHQ